MNIIGGILYVGMWVCGTLFYDRDRIGIVFYKMCITIYEVTVNIVSRVPDK
jgi:hypothetical protein